MKRVQVRLFFSVLAFCSLVAVQPRKAHADTVTMKFVGPGGANSGGVYTYPYNFDIESGGTTTLSSLMCYAYQDEIETGETWTATVESIPTGNTQDEELAWLFTEASDPSYTTASNPPISPNDTNLAQWAAWYLFDPTATIAYGSDGIPSMSAINSELAWAYGQVQNNTNSNFYSGFELYLPVNGTESWAGHLPQSFIGGSPDAPPPVPEPKSLMLLGTGLLALAGLIFREKNALRNTGRNCTAEVH